MYTNYFFLYILNSHIVFIEFNTLFYIDNSTDSNHSKVHFSSKSLFEKQKTLLVDFLYSSSFNTTFFLLFLYFAFWREEQNQKDDV